MDTNLVPRVLVHPPVSSPLSMSSKHRERVIASRVFSSSIAEKLTDQLPDLIEGRSSKFPSLDIEDVAAALRANRSAACSTSGTPTEASSEAEYGAEASSAAAILTILDAKYPPPKKLEHLRYLYRVGAGPSSSHTLAPSRAARRFLKATEKFPVDKYVVTLYGSLAATGKGHRTDAAIIAVLGDSVEFVWRDDIEDPVHTNKMMFEAYDAEDKKLDMYTCYSVGGGALVDASTAPAESEHFLVYPLTSMRSIMRWCAAHGRTLSDYALAYEGDEVLEYMDYVWSHMKACVERGLKARGEIPGGLHVPRKAATLQMKGKRLSSDFARTPLLMSYAYAVSEENACGGTVVTAPTCGACGVVPAVLYYLQSTQGFSDEDIHRALLTAGVVGNIAKSNASISGAECGCAAEVGVATSMAAAAAVDLFGGSVRQMETAAQSALEHALGLTCDPVMGQVVVPCVERNGAYACRALASAEYALCTDGTHMVSYDETLLTMKLSGLMLDSGLRETSRAGLATAWGLDDRLQLRAEAERLVRFADHEGTSDE